METLLYLFLFALLVLAAVAVVFVVKSYLSGQSPTAALFGPRPERRLGIVEHAALDGRRRLVLIRRDGVEHLIMTGGPVDVVIETGIGERADAAVAKVAATPVFSRQPRNLAAAAEGERVPDRAAE